MTTPRRWPGHRTYRAVRRAAGTVLRPWACAGGIALLKLLPTREPPRAVLRLLIWGWGNRPFSADTSYLASMARLAIQQGGAVLECGSGVSTLVLGVLASKQQFSVFVLEHDRNWHDRVARNLRRHRLTGVKLHHAPLEDHGRYHWYSIADLRLPVDVRLVVCDGPPGPTLGGRYGLLPVLEDGLAPECLILLDDVDRPGERQVLDLWSREFAVERVDAGGARHAVLKVTQRARPVPT